MHDYSSRNGIPAVAAQNVPHGLACGIFLGEYLKAFRDQSLVLPIVKACGFENCDDFAEYVRMLTNRDVNIEVSEAEIEYWTDQFMNIQKWRLEANPEELSREDINRLYRTALAKYIKK